MVSVPVLREPAELDEQLLCDQQVPAPARRNTAMRRE